MDLQLPPVHPINNYTHHCRVMTIASYNELDHDQKMDLLRNEEEDVVFNTIPSSYKSRFLEVKESYHIDRFLLIEG